MLAEEMRATTIFFQTRLSPFLISVQQFIRTLVLSAWVDTMRISHPEIRRLLASWKARLFHMQFIIMSDTVHTRFSLWKLMFARCWYSARVRTHVRSPLRLWQTNDNKTALSHKHAVALSGPEIVPVVIVNHQRRRRRRKVLLSLRCGHALGHGCYFIIPPSTATVNLFHYVAMSVRVSAVCTCMLLRSGFISSAALSFSQTGDKARGPPGSKPPSYYSTRAGCHSGTAAGMQGKINSKKHGYKWQEIVHVWVFVHFQVWKSTRVCAIQSSRMIVV